jgi:hypothetical protein
MGGAIAFGVTAPATTVTVGGGGGSNGANGLWGGVGGASSYGAIKAFGGGQFQFDGSGVGRQWIIQGVSKGQGVGSQQPYGNGELRSFIGGGIGGNNNAGGAGGFNLQFTGASTGAGYAGCGAGVAGNAVSGTGKGGLGGGGAAGSTPSGSGSGGDGIVYLYY